MNSIDIFVQNHFSLIRTSHVTEFMYLLSRLFDLAFPFISVVIIVAILIYIVRNLDYAFLFLFSLFFGTVLVYFLKLFFDINRPLDGVTQVLGQSFPSFHTTIATIFFIMLMYIFDDYLKTLSRIILNCLCVVGILLVSFSRVYLGVHWASDILGGIILGGALSCLFITIFKTSKNVHSFTSMLR